MNRLPKHYTELLDKDVTYFQQFPTKELLYSYKLVSRIESNILYDHEIGYDTKENVEQISRLRDRMKSVLDTREHVVGKTKKERKAIRQEAAKRKC